MAKKKNVSFNDIATHQKGPQTGDSFFTNGSLSVSKDAAVITPKKQSKASSDQMSHIEVELEGRYKYNKIIDQIDPRYTQDQIIMVEDFILVRLLLLPGVAGFTMKPETIAVPNRAGTGGFEEQDDLYPYDNIGIVVNINNSTSKDYNIKKGEFVRVSNLVTETKFAQGRQYLKYAYLHHDADNELQYEGYVRIRPFDVINKLPNFNLKNYVNNKHKRKS